MYPAKSAIIFLDQYCSAQAHSLAEELHLPIVNSITEDFSAYLVVSLEHVALQLISNEKFSPIYVDFLQGELAHRKQYGGGKSQLIAKAFALKKSPKPTVLDLTAGLARDAFTLACLGCDVTMVERSPIIAALVRDGLQRAENDPAFQKLNLTLVQNDAMEYLSALNLENFPDIIYLDPMFPERKKSALVKKEMRILRAVVGEDFDAPEILQAALLKARKRVVVKRPRHAPNLGVEPDLVYQGESSRFDVYLS